MSVKIFVKTCKKSYSMENAFLLILLLGVYLAKGVLKIPQDFLVSLSILRSTLVISVHFGLRLFLGHNCLFWIITAYFENRLFLLPESLLRSTTSSFFQLYYLRRGFSRCIFLPSSCCYIFTP